MAIYKNINYTGPEVKPSNLGVQKKDSQSVIDYLAGFNGDVYSFNAGEYDAVIAFFNGKDFDRTSSETLAYIILRQSRIDNVPVFQILDNFNDLSVLELNEVIAEIINLNRYKTSVLGFRQERSPLSFANRNIKV